MRGCILTLDTDALSPAVFDALTRRLPEVRQKRLVLLPPEKRRGSAGAAALACCALAQPLCADPVPQELTAGRLLDAAWLLPEDWTPDEHGKPFAAGLDTPAGRRYLSLSHTDGVAAAVVSDAPVGLDVQRTPAFSPERLERFCRRLHPQEAEALRRLPESERAAGFCRLWVGKESVLKLTGTGLTVPLAGFALPTDADDACIPLAGETVRVRWFPLADGALAAAVYDRKKGNDDHAFKG